MRRLLKWLGTILLFLVVAACLAPTLIPPFLDRIYYRGPVSDHFDGERFFNPGAPALEQAGGPARFANRWLGGERAEWPQSVPVQTAGLNILTDPVWSERASPFSFIGPRRVSAPGVAFEQLPKIDLVLISHNHYDHMDLATLERLWERDRPLIVTSLGNDTILKGRGIPAVARDWGEHVPVRPGIDVLVERNHHWSSRWGTDRNRALWSAFTVRLPGGSIFFAGDTGFGDGSWVREAAAHGPFRLAILPIGAYEPRDFMKDHHINPEESMRIYQALAPVAGLGIHWGTVQLTFEPIDDPLRRLAALRRAAGASGRGFIATPIGRTFSVPPASPRR
jgi:L-ascorbate metabolism protein UlaG (beta-lactamase superfamily)